MDAVGRPTDCFAVAPLTVLRHGGDRHSGDTAAWSVPLRAPWALPTTERMDPTCHSFPNGGAYSGLKTPLRSTQKFLRRDVDGEGVALRGLRPLWRLRRPRHVGSSCDVLELPAPCYARLLARSGAAAFGRSGHWQRGLRPRWRLRRPLTLALACDCLEPGSPISRVCSLASPGRHVRFTQKASSPRGRLILRRAQNSN